MKNLIEYLLLFIVVLLFCPSNYWSIIYCAISLSIYLGYLVLYLRLKNKGDRENDKQIDINFILILVMIIVLNLVSKLGFANLIFGFIVLVMFVFNSLILLKKEGNLNKKVLKTKYLFDIYSIVYLTNLIVMVLKYEL